MPDIIPLDMPAAYWRGKAQQARRVGNPREAVRLYRAALRKQADNAIRRELAEVFGDMRCLSASDRLYLENLARDTSDADSLYGLARNRSLAGDESGMADLLDLFLRLSPCGEQADRARDILWQMPRDTKPAPRKSRAIARFHQAMDAQSQPGRSLRRARQSWSRGKTPETARLLCQLYLSLGRKEQAMKYASIACDLAPEDMIARQLLAVALLANDMPHASRQALKQAAKLCKSIDQLPVFCGCAAYLQQGNLAAELVQEWLAQYPDSADLMLLLASVLWDMPGQEERAKALIREAQALDESNPLAEFMVEGRDHHPAEQVSQVMRQLQRINEAITDGPPEEMDQRLHQELVRAMRLPIPGMLETVVTLFMKNEDMLGLRMVMAENELPAMLYGVILSYFQEMKAPLPCFARVNGRLMLLPQKPRPPYDADLHALIHTLLHGLPDAVPLDLVVREVPALWQRLPLSARRHCAQSRDRLWPTAFTAYLLLRAGKADKARERFSDCKCPRRARRAFMQLVRRSKKPYEVHRF